MDECFTCRARGSRWRLERVLRPVGWIGRGLGLLRRPALRPGEGLWLDPCGGIHTWGMRYPIDVLFLDRHRCLLAVRSRLPPWRLALAPRGTRSVLELPAGGAAGLEPGAALEFTPAPYQQ